MNKVHVALGPSHTPPTPEKHLCLVEWLQEVATGVISYEGGRSIDRISQAMRHFVKDVWLTLPRALQWLISKLWWKELI
jgi:hypothetical protein